jgi:hypothetical protein
MYTTWEATFSGANENICSIEPTCVENSQNYFNLSFRCSQQNTKDDLSLFKKNTHATPENPQTLTLHWRTNFPGSSSLVMNSSHRSHPGIKYGDLMPMPTRVASPRLDTEETQVRSSTI